MFSLAHVPFGYTILGTQQLFACTARQTELGSYRRIGEMGYHPGAQEIARDPLEVVRPLTHTATYWSK